MAPTAARKAAAVEVKERRGPVLPQELQHEAILEFDVRKHAFEPAMRLVLEVAEGTPLGNLHDSPLGAEVLRCFHRRAAETTLDAMGPRGNPWNAMFLGAPNEKPEHWAVFADAFHEFVRTFVLEDLGTARVAFQSRPTFRCHLPDCGAPGRPHRDADYHHHPSEVNYWIPVTPVFGSNSLYVETRRGAGDFRPLELDYGKLVRFYANQVWHYTIPNETQATRVSFDFRVVREEEWSPEAFVQFRLGAYFSVMTREGLIPAKSPEMHALQEQYSCLPMPKKQKKQ